MKNLLFAIITMVIMNVQVRSEPQCRCIDFDSVLPSSSSFMYGADAGILDAGMFFDSPCNDPFIVTFTWDYGDGTTHSETVYQTGGGNVVNPSSVINHVYNSPGNYTVCLTVTFQGWQYCVKEFCEDIVISAGDPCGFEPVFDISSNDNTCAWAFTDATWSSMPFGVSILDINWDFGDGNTTSGYSVVHNYSEVGAYTICMEIWTTDGTDCCMQKTCQEIGITDICDPCAVMGSGGISVFSDAEVYTFSETNLDKLSDYDYAYFWDFGDGNNAIGKVVSHTYESPDFDVSLASLSIYYYNQETGECCKNKIFDFPAVQMVGSNDESASEQNENQLSIGRSLPTSKNVNQKLTIFPNPSSDRFMIKVSNNTINQISILDQTGKLMFSDKNVASVDKYNLDLSGFEAGFYIIVINEDDAQNRMFDKLLIARN